MPENNPKKMAKGTFTNLKVQTHLSHQYMQIQMLSLGIYKKRIPNFTSKSSRIFRGRLDK